jgi:signal transduction histidine kinase
MPADSGRAILIQLYGHLFPGAAERDPALRHEIWRLSRIGLQVIGGVQIAVSMFMMLGRLLVAPGSSVLSFRLKQGGAIILLGLLTLICARMRSLQQWWRPLGVVSGLLTAAILVWSSLVVNPGAPRSDDFIPGHITLIMLVGVTVMPLRPVHVLWMGLGMGFIYALAAVAARSYSGAGPGVDANYLLFIFMLSLLAMGITAVVYEQRRSNFNLRQEQVRALLAENASSLTHLAAALSHELNNPMGALLSGVDTLLLLASKQATCQPQEQGRLVLLQSDVRKSIQQSAQRLKGLVARIQRFTNLDQAEVQQANVNDLLSDVAALVEPQLPAAASLRLDLEPLQPILCRPQQISAVFSNLVTNAVRALNGTGGEVTIASRQKLKDVEIEIRDNGKGVGGSQLARIFEPSFRASGDSVRATNWSMFSSRQIIREHGGDIHVDSGEGKGTTVRVTLPSAKG